jgi:hypothetical protein
MILRLSCCPVMFIRYPCIYRIFIDVRLIHLLMQSSSNAATALYYSLLAARLARLPCQITCTEKLNPDKEPSIHRHPRTAPTEVSDQNFPMQFLMESPAKSHPHKLSCANFCSNTNVPLSIMIKSDTALRNYTPTTLGNSSLDYSAVKISHTEVCFLK